MPIDYLGKLIKPGCHIVYPMRRGSRMWLTTMKVEGIELISTDGSFLLLGLDATGRRTRTKNIQNCIVI